MEKSFHKKASLIITIDDLSKTTTMKTTTMILLYLKQPIDDNAIALLWNGIR